ncbi:MAG: universal stress protein [Acidimicrobiia bacterium]|nr:universal stress protein [Acidimicrobiia bacterium]
MEPTSTSAAAPALGGPEPLTELVVPVVAKGFYDRGAAIAARLAVRWGTSVRLVHVATPSDPVDEDAVAAAAARLRAARPGVTVAADRVESVDDGPSAVADAVIGALRDRSLVVMATDHVTRWLGAGSVGEEIVRRAPMPVLLCGPHTDSEHVFGALVVAVDGSPTAEAAMPEALALARGLSASLTAVQIVDAATTAHVARLRAEGEQVAESSYLSGLVADMEVAGVELGWEIIHADDPVEGILAFAGRKDAGMLVMGTHGLSGATRRAFGSVTMGVVEKSPTPVLVVRDGAGAEGQLGS